MALCILLLPRVLTNLVAGVVVRNRGIKPPISPVESRACLLLFLKRSGGGEVRLSKDEARACNNAEVSRVERASPC